MNFFKNLSHLFFSLFLFWPPSFSFAQDGFYITKDERFLFTEKGASHLASLPLKCLDKEFPYKTGITFLDSTLVTRPANYHPAFFGCYDWHSSVHGHWMLVRLLKQFPHLPQAETIRKRLSDHLTAENIRTEISVFKADNVSFERIYGWGWFLQLQGELLASKEPWAKELARNMEPLATFFSKSWINFLKKIVYPIRVGEHTNLAFGLTLTWDYAVTAKDTALQGAIKEAAFRFYLKDKNCPITWEPGGYDFLSPCLEEARLMSKLMPREKFVGWLKSFMPGLFTNPGVLLKIAVVKDRTDGKLVHLDGLNFSRAWCLYEIAKHLPGQTAKSINALAFQHLNAALPHIASGDYAGEHWLASFAVYALAINHELN